MERPPFVRRIAYRKVGNSRKEIERVIKEAKKRSAADTFTVTYEADFIVVRGVKKGLIHV